MARGAGGAGRHHEDEVRGALTELDPLWEELFPAEHARIVHLVREVAGSRRAAA